MSHFMVLNLFPNYFHTTLLNIHILEEVQLVFVCPYITFLLFLNLFFQTSIPEKF